MTDPDGATVRHEYNGLETHTYDAKGIHSYTVQTNDGNIAARFELNPRSPGWLVTQFEYGSFGEVTKIIAPDGTERTMTYDLLGRRIGHTDPDAGESTSAFNAFGELVEAQDAEGRKMHFVYDPLGRPLDIKSDDGVATYRWDKAVHGIGMLATATSADGIVTSYDYDVLGRNVRTVWELDGFKCEIGMSYDGHGRLAAILYPENPRFDSARRCLRLQRLWIS
jgi:YD repeat-containing protein